MSLREQFSIQLVKNKELKMRYDREDKRAQKKEKLREQIMNAFDKQP